MRSRKPCLPFIQIIGRTRAKSRRKCKKSEMEEWAAENRSVYLDASRVFFFFSTATFIQVAWSNHDISVSFLCLQYNCDLQVVKRGLLSDDFSNVKSRTWLPVWFNFDLSFPLFGKSQENTFGFLRPGEEIGFPSFIWNMKKTNTHTHTHTYT